MAWRPRAVRADRGHAGGSASDCFHATHPGRSVQFPPLALNYVPAGTWTHLQTGAAVRGPAWVSEVCDFQTVPVLVRPASVLPVGSRDDRPDYAYDEDVTLRAYEFPDGGRSTVTVPGPTGEVAAAFDVTRDGNTLTATRLRGAAGWRLASGPTGPAASVPADTDRASVQVWALRPGRAELR